MGALCGELPVEDVFDATYAAYWWEKDGRNHLIDRELFTPGAEVFWPRCTRGRKIPQRTMFRGELSEHELGADRDTSQDCRACFFRLDAR